MAKTKLTSADEKFIQNFINFDGKLNFGTDPIFRKNEYSEEEFEVCPICAACIDFVREVEGAFQSESTLKSISPALTLGNAVQSFDRARYIIMKMNPAAYYGIID